MTVSNQAAQHAVVRPQTIRTRIIMPPHAALAHVVEELVQNPLTDDELRVLSDMGTATDTLVVEKVEAQLEGTRILALLRMLVAKTNITVSDCVVILLMIYQTYVMLHPPQPEPPPAPQVTVNVTVDSDEIAQKVAKRLQNEGIRVTTSRLMERQSHTSSPPCEQALGGFLANRLFQHVSPTRGDHHGRRRPGTA